MWNFKINCKFKGVLKEKSIISVRGWLEKSDSWNQGLQSLGKPFDVKEGSSEKVFVSAHQTHDRFSYS